MSLDSDLRYAEEVARRAGTLVREQFGKVSRLTKRNEEAVTDADRASQRLIVAALRERFPGDGLIGEENDTGDAITFECRDPAGRNWVIDPIDGTNNFIAGLGAFAVCIGLLEAGTPVLGVVYDVTRDLMYRAARGEGAWLGKQRLRVAGGPLGPSSILMLTSNLLNAQGAAPAFASRWIAQTHWKIRILGSAALEAVQVAAGIAHAAVTLNGKLWDVVAPAAIVLEAGGLVTDPQGKPVFPYDLRHYSGAKVPFIAATPPAHVELLAEIAR